MEHLHTVSFDRNSEYAAIVEKVLEIFIIQLSTQERIAVHFGDK